MSMRSAVRIIADRHFIELHIVLCKCASLVTKDVINLAQRLI